MSHYTTYKNADLRRILQQRGLRSSGNKAELVSRLIAYDIDHPFRFLDLPAEIRNEIYKFAASCEHTPKKTATKSVVERRGLPPHLYAGETENQASIMQPGLFRTCSQIHTESRGLFYSHHAFKLHLWQESKGILSNLAVWLRLWQGKTCLERATRWLDAIGAEAREHVRTLEVEVHCDGAASAKDYTEIIDHLHSRLSDEATVVYRSASRKFDVLILYDLGAVFYERDPARVPHFEQDIWTSATNPWTTTRSLLLRLPARHRVPRPSLTFGPGLGWFGNRSPSS